MPEEDLVPVWDLADRMNKSLRVRNIGVQDIAEAFGVSRNTVSRWLGGRGVPTKAQRFFWATLTGVNLHWLETGQAPKPLKISTPDTVPLPRLDSNQQPSGYRPRHLRLVRSVKQALTPNWGTLVGPTFPLVVAL